MSTVNMSLIKSEIHISTSNCMQYSEAKYNPVTIFMFAEIVFWDFDSSSEPRGLLVTMLKVTAEILLYL